MLFRWQCFAFCGHYLQRINKANPGLCRFDNRIYITSFGCSIRISEIVFIFLYFLLSFGMLFLEGCGGSKTDDTQTLKANAGVIFAVLICSGIQS